MQGGTPIKDAHLPNGLRWEVPGSFRDANGTWELVVDLNSNTIVHFNFIVNRMMYKMIRLCADTNKPMADGYVFYNSSENGIDTYPEKNSEITLLCTYIQTGFVSGDSDDTNYVNNMCANQIFGLAPYQSWKAIKLNIPKVTHKCALRLLDVFDWGTKRLDKGDDEWEMFFDSSSGWFCVGDPDFKGTINVNFIENAIATLNSQGEIKALWIKPVFRDDISLTI